MLAVLLFYLWYKLGNIAEDRPSFSMEESIEKEGLLEGHHTPFICNSTKTRLGGKQVYDLPDDKRLL